MRNVLVLTASVAALVAAQSIAIGADEKAAPARPLTPTSPGAGAIMMEDDVRSDPTMEKRRATVPIHDAARSAERTGYRSYADSDSKASASIPGGLSAEAFIGADVLGPSGEEIGEVTDLVIGRDNRIEKAIVEVGGFLGVGTKSVAIEIAQLKPTGKKDAYVTAATREELKMRVEYEKKSGVWVERPQ